MIRYVQLILGSIVMFLWASAGYMNFSLALKEYSAAELVVSKITVWWYLLCLLVYVFFLKIIIKNK